MKRDRRIKIFNHEKNMGKGAAIRTAIKHAKGDLFIIQDADLEYNPEEIKKLLIPILEGKADVAYGSRMLGNISGFNISSHYYGNILLSGVTRILFCSKITDMETCYKLVPTKIMREIKLKAEKFDIEPEITAKILKLGYKITEVPISYNSRSFTEGKKIKWTDGVQAIWTLLKYRLMN